jgi:hypothetical protein
LTAAIFISSVIAERAHVERAAEDEREPEHVVDLVREVGLPGGDDRVRARGQRVGYGISGSGFAIAKTIGRGRHLL